MYRHGIKAIELVFLDQLDEFAGVGGIRGIARTAQTPRPSLVVISIQVEKRTVTHLLAQIVRMRPVGFLRVRIDAEAFVGTLVVIQETLPLPAGIALQAEMVVRLGGQRGLPRPGLQQRLGEGDARRHAGTLHLVHRQRPIAVDVGLARILSGAEHRQRQGKQEGKHSFHRH